jgi:hypothetical protein
MDAHRREEFMVVAVRSRNRCAQKAVNRLVGLVGRGRTRAELTERRPDVSAHLVVPGRDFERELVRPPALRSRPLIG